MAKEGLDLTLRAVVTRKKARLKTSDVSSSRVQSQRLQGENEQAGSFIKRKLTCYIVINERFLKFPTFENE